MDFTYQQPQPLQETDTPLQQNQQFQAPQVVTPTQTPSYNSPVQTQAVQRTTSTSINDEFLDDIELLEKEITDAKMPKELEDRALRYIDRIRKSAKRGSYTGEYESIEKYIYWITKVPWGNMTQDNLDINNAKQLMDSTHYGMDVVKNLILDYMAVMQLQLKSSQQVSNVNPMDMAVLRGNSANAPVMIFVGLQGVGKTSIAKSIAKAMGRKFVRVAVGAIGDVKVLRGSPRGYPDSEPGQIVKALVRSGSMNPVILLDEIDKASGNISLLSDVMAALLEILDPEQNATFVDHYVDYPVDLSKVFFICTANNLGTLSAALLDRMEVIRFTSYSDQEKEVIARKYSFPIVLSNTGLSPDMIKISDEVWPLLIRPVGFDAGLRQLERNLATLVRSAARKILEGSPVPIVITPENVRQFVLPDQGPLS
jgi:ATP-dependent Lon protease